MLTPAFDPDLGADPAGLAATKAQVWEFINQVPGPQWRQALATQVAAQAEWHVFHPINGLSGAQAVADGLYGPLIQAFPDLERRTDIFFGGHWDGHIVGGQGHWCTAVGHYMGTFTHPWQGIAPTGKTACLRFGEFYRCEGGRIVEARVLLDIVDLARQAGVALLPPSPGADLLVPGPRLDRKSVV